MKKQHKMVRNVLLYKQALSCISMRTNEARCFICLRFLRKSFVYGAYVLLPPIAYCLQQNVLKCLQCCKMEEEFNGNVVFTSRLWDHTIAGGGSGANLTTHVRFIVLSLLIKRSGPPWISVIGSVDYKGKNGQLVLETVRFSSNLYDVTLEYIV